MSEEASEHDATAKEPPSFNGRLQLKNFVFNGGTPHTIRRSPRLLQTSQTPASGSATPSEPASPAPPRTAQKRKSTKQQKNTQDEDINTTTTTSPSPRKNKRTRTSSAYAPPSTYAHLPPLQDVIAPNLLILFIGLNPGVQTARSGHAYAHPSNLFWKLLYSSGLTPVPCKPEEDGTLPARFGLGNTNIVARPSRNGAELSKAEMDAGVAVLEAKCRRWRPEVVCVVGKSIWESIFRVWRGRNLSKGEFEYGWQTERMGAVPPARDSAGVRIGAGEKSGEAGRILEERAGSLENGGADVDGGDEGDESGRGEEDAAEKERKEKVDDGPWEGARIFVATSTSGLAASLRPEEKERIWKILGDWCVQRRKERGEWC
ncbi:uracil-DNA glycosylase-like protein [Xylaria sp. FL0043]|nr:uracil-DNA glycosylase-like protein [Xylaria sp. FL0043]